MRIIVADGLSESRNRRGSHFQSLQCALLDGTIRHHHRFPTRGVRDEAHARPQRRLHGPCGPQMRSSSRAAFAWTSSKMRRSASSTNTREGPQRREAQSYRTGDREIQRKDPHFEKADARRDGEFLYIPPSPRSIPTMARRPRCSAWAGTRVLKTRLTSGGDFPLVSLKHANNAPEASP
jgi:hypothetical protein